MLAYLFWHRPCANVDKAAYESSLVAFHDSLARRAPPGFIAAGSFAIGAVPWLGQRGYEDWCLIEGAWAMEPLNASAITGASQPPHDAAAALMEEGHGGLYGQVWGEAKLPSASTITWLTRPRGIDWRAALEPLRTALPDAGVWRRQMVLGPAPEFAIVTGKGREVPKIEGWLALSVSRTRLTAD